jgi:hypothetical protein
MPRQMVAMPSSWMMRRSTGNCKQIQDMTVMVGYLYSWSSKAA